MKSTFLDMVSSAFQKEKKAIQFFTTLSKVKYFSEVMYEMSEKKFTGTLIKTSYFLPSPGIKGCAFNQKEMLSLALKMTTLDWTSLKKKVLKNHSLFTPSFHSEYNYRVLGHYLFAIQNVNMKVSGQKFYKSTFVN
jgi:hypothetical protein